ncbi:MAG TPA: hypothetical protein DEB10_00190 [Ruminococcaceae bacterium]|jgi:hypothetical protein|nr:hypothetical protein [Oscillospiraceae bacterium]
MQTGCEVGFGIGAVPGEKYTILPAQATGIFASNGADWTTPQKYFPLPARNGVQRFFALSVN